MHITKVLVESTKPPATDQIFIRDDAIKGLALRVTANGVKSFIFEGRINKRPRRLTLGQWPAMSVVLARKRALEIRTEIARGEDPYGEHQAEKHEPAFGDLVDRYMQHSQLHKRPRSIK